MREFAHTGSDDRDALDLNQVLEACLRVASPHRRGATRIEEAHGELPPVSVGQTGNVRVETRLERGRAIVG
jgi:hypothetical protein